MTFIEMSEAWINASHIESIELYGNESEVRMVSGRVHYSNKSPEEIMARVAGVTNPAGHVSPRLDNPLTVAGELRYARVLRALLSSLDREIVDAALIGDSESDLLDSEREVVDRVREFLDGRVLTPLVLDGRRRRGLALLDAFEDEFFAAAHHDSSPTVAAPVLVTPDANTPTVDGGAGTPASARPGPVTPIDGAGAFEGGVS